MPSISHRASLGQGAPHRAKSGPTALPAGFTRGLTLAWRLIRAIVGWPIRWCADRLEDWRALRQLRDLDDHLLRDIGLTVAEAQRATIFHSRRDRDAHDPKGPPTWPTTS
jgi:uncharacterized protein YjiS (DUF1127 family)